MSLNKNHGFLEVVNLQTKKLRKKSTKAEKILWTELRNRKFLNIKFYRQFAIIHDILGKETFYIADFYSYEKKIVIELDGKIHNYQLRKDNLKDDVMRSLGLRVIRFNNNEVEKDTNKALLKLKEFILIE
jgi:very-short-patch-repair endonuclease